MTDDSHRARLRDIIAKRSFGRGAITLASGRKSDFYFNLKPTMLDAEGAALLAELTLDALQGRRIDYVGGLEMGAVPLRARSRSCPSCAASRSRRSSCARSRRSMAQGCRSKGSRRASAGRQARGDRGGRHYHRRLGDQGGEAVRDAGAEIVMVFTMVDREEGADRQLPRRRLNFRSLYKAAEFLKRLKRSLSCRVSGRLPNCPISHFSGGVWASRAQPNTVLPRCSVLNAP